MSGRGVVEVDEESGRDTDGVMRLDERRPFERRMKSFIWDLLPRMSTVILGQIPL